jgi:hypothetical protein
MGNIPQRSWLHLRTRYLRGLQPEQRSHTCRSSSSVGYGGLQLVARPQCRHYLLRYDLYLSGSIGPNVDVSPQHPTTVTDVVIRQLSWRSMSTSNTPCLCSPTAPCYRRFTDCPAVCSLTLAQGWVNRWCRGVSFQYGSHTGLYGILTLDTGTPDYFL